MEWHAVHLYFRNGSRVLDFGFLLVLSVSLLIFPHQLNLIQNILEYNIRAISAGELISFGNVLFSDKMTFHDHVYLLRYSTIGLILMTSLFLVMIPLLTLVGFFSSHIEHENQL